MVKKICEKKIAPTLATLLCDIFNSSLTEGIVLVLKKQVVTVLIPKTNS